jgi:hypothetical protein
LFLILLGIFLCAEFGLSSPEVEAIANEFGAQHDFTVGFPSSSSSSSPSPPFSLISCC